MDAHSGIFSFPFPIFFSLLVTRDILCTAQEVVSTLLLYLRTLVNRSDSHIWFSSKFTDARTYLFFVRSFPLSFFFCFFPSLSISLALRISFPLSIHSYFSPTRRASTKPAKSGERSVIILSRKKMAGRVTPRERRGVGFVQAAPTNTERPIERLTKESWLIEDDRSTYRPIDRSID